MKLYINAIGHYTPKEVIPNDYFKKMNGLDDEWIFKRTGIKTRVRSTEEENSNSMGIDAVKALATQYTGALEGVDLIVGATYSPYDTVLTLAHAVQREFELKGAKATTITSACSSFVNALEIAEMYIKAGKCQKALIVASECNSCYSNDVCSKSGHLWGDGAGCVVISAEKTNEKDPEIVDIISEGLGHIGQADESVYLRPANGKLEMPIGRDVFVNACTYMAKAVEDITLKNGITTDEIDYLIPHQANIRIMRNVASGLKIPEEKVVTNVDTLGNTGSASTVIGLSQIYSEVKSGSNVVFTVFGGGYSMGGVYVKF